MTDSPLAYHITFGTCGTRLHGDERGGWTYHIAACLNNHVHVMLSTSNEGKAVRKWLKRWLSEALNETWPDVPLWWAKGGSVKWVWDDWYLDNLYQYIREQRQTPNRD